MIIIALRFGNPPTPLATLEMARPPSPGDRLAVNTATGIVPVEVVSLHSETINEGSRFQETRIWALVRKFERTGT